MKVRARCRRGDGRKTEGTANETRRFHWSCRMRQICPCYVNYQRCAAELSVCSLGSKEKRVNPGDVALQNAALFWLIPLFSPYPALCAQRYRASVYSPQPPWTSSNLNPVVFFLSLLKTFCHGGILTTPENAALSEQKPICSANGFIWCLSVRKTSDETVSHIATL